MYGLEIPNDALEMFFPPFLGNASIGVVLKYDVWFWFLLKLYVMYIDSDSFKTILLKLNVNLLIQNVWLC